MAFAASDIEITLRYTNLSQNCQTARVYTWDGAAIAAATPAQVGEAWWNHYKDAWRALAVSASAVAQFLSVIVREVGGGLAYGEYAIPSGEQLGTRDGTGLGNPLPPFVATGCRLTVGTGITRPGQMRIPFALEGDSDGSVFNATWLGLCEDLADLYSNANTLGAPVATGVLFPQVVRFGVDNDTIAAGQDIVGFVLKPQITSQVSRRIGHGS